MTPVKAALRNSPLRPVYLWFANRYRGLKRLFSYPDTAHIGGVNYDDYWDAKAQSGLGKLSPWRLRRAKVFAGIVAEGDSVLDIGVGDGALLQYLVEHKQITAYGLDLSPKAVDFCHSIGLTGVQLGDANRPIHEVTAAAFGSDLRFDYAICSEIIEHLPEPETLLNDLRQVVRKGIIVSIPNTGFHQHRLRLLFGKFPLQWVVTPGEHLRFWTLGDFRWWARQLGFEVAAIVPYEGTAGLKNVLPGLFAAAFVYVLIDARPSGGTLNGGTT
ncbi:MAG: methyltransferase domain-containing protein [Anaerolineae bacterium]|nr:methyltransferase domain-containing protein [Anaerolineae bacterium]